MSENGVKMKGGIEIHQQLDTNKLFCNCPSELRNEPYEIAVKRKLYAVAGESGKVDAAAAYEESKKRTYVYEGYVNSTCEIELDESPPRELNEEALKIGIQISLLLNAKPLSVTQVMRKTVVDGSNTSGFQRTVLIARNGWVEVKGKKIGIASINLEEDSARRISENKDGVTYRLDRLGIPLVEIATNPDISSPEEVKEVALKIGEILRSCKVKRGIGTIRQDINVSIEGGERTEIKGVQDPSLFAKVVGFEVGRQLQLIKEGEKVEKTVRNALPDGTNKFLRPMPSAARLYPETDLPLLKISEDLVKHVKLHLPKLKSEVVRDLVKRGLNPEYANILIDEVKVERFEKLLKEFKSKTSSDLLNLIAKMLVLFPKDISNREGLSLESVEAKLRNDALISVLEAVQKGKLQESLVKSVLTEVVKGRKLNEVLGKAKESSSSSEIKSEVKKLTKEKPGLSHGAYMGLLMTRFKGKVDPKELSDILKQEI